MRPAELIDNFYESIKDKYPDLSRDKVKEVCTAPFTMVKDVMKEGKLEDIRLKYFGVFRVFPGRVKGMKNIIFNRLKMGKLSKPEYDGINEMLNNHIKENPQKFKKNGK